MAPESAWSFTPHRVYIVMYRMHCGARMRALPCCGHCFCLQAQRGPIRIQINSASGHFWGSCPLQGAQLGINAGISSCSSCSAVLWYTRFSFQLFSDRRPFLFMTCCETSLLAFVVPKVHISGQLRKGSMHYGILDAGQGAGELW